ncbi:hypothetical protein [Rossellomorea sp. NPDC077527]|uniref:hypothetical protein n=1 Tax=Rossellomorea sp. NPDC077527 TaxID=3364510 RepID=UPI0037C88D00
MTKKLLFSVLFILLLSACSQNEVEDSSPNTKDITLKEVLNVIREQGLELEDTSDLPKENVFIQKLNGVTPEVYGLEGNTLSIYIFPTSNERGKAVQAFEEKTATYDLIEHQEYGIHNLLVFYVSEDEKIQDELFDALQSIDS